MCVPGTLERWFQSMGDGIIKSLQLGFPKQTQYLQTPSFNRQSLNQMYNGKSQQHI